MASFKDNFRIERVYFERLKTMIDVLKSYKDSVTEEPARTILENSIDVDGATLLLYRNLGEAWAELADLIQKTRELLQELDEKTEAYHDELNERIDEVNNYLMALIRALEARVDAIEADLAQMGRLFTYELTRANDTYSLTESGNAVTFSDTVAKYTHNRAHLVTVRGNVDGETTYFFPREYDTSAASGVFEWYAFGFVGNEIHEITVTLLPDNSVNVAIETTDFTSILSRLATAETNINNLLTRMTTAETDIDTLEQQVENLGETKQDALTAGSGISIDPDTGIITNTAQGATYTAGDGIVIENGVIYNNNFRTYLEPTVASGETNQYLATFGKASNYSFNDTRCSVYGSKLISTTLTATQTAICLYTGVNIVYTNQSDILSIEKEAFITGTLSVNYTIRTNDQDTRHVINIGCVPLRLSLFNKLSNRGHFIANGCTLLQNVSKLVSSNDCYINLMLYGDLVSDITLTSAEWDTVNNFIQQTFYMKLFKYVGTFI